MEIEIFMEVEEVFLLYRIIMILMLLLWLLLLHFQFQWR